jgi:peptidoglycan/LPS O-acetylase OafA/YrhL
VPTLGMNLYDAKQNFPALTGVRALAVYLVYLHHTNPLSPEAFGILSRFVDELHIGVSIFFVLSGFLITHRYYGAFRGKEKWFGEYFRNRLARVYPMYFVMTTLTFFLLYIGNEKGINLVKVYLLNISFLRGFFDEFKFSMVGQGWSLTVEECFYFSAPLIFFLLTKSKWFLMALPPSLILMGCLLVKIFGSPGWHGFFANYQFMFIYTFFGRCFEFFCGIGLALYVRKQTSSEQRGSMFTLGGIFLVVLLVLVMAMQSENNKPGIYTTWGAGINNFLLPIAISIFFYGLIVETSLARKILSSPLFILLGRSSYTFYLIHVGFFYAFIHQNVTQNYLLVFLALNILAISLWHWVEEPANRAIKKFWHP